MFAILLYAAGFLLPYALTCLILWHAGVLHDFVFWTISYAGKYASNVPIAYASKVLGPALGGVIGANLGLWLLAGAGAVVMWWDKRLASRSLSPSEGERVGARGPFAPFSRYRQDAPTITPPRSPCFFLVALLACSVASVSVGFHFRPHYFITLLPVLSLLCGIGVSRGVQLFQHDESVEPLISGLKRIVAIPVLGTFVVGSLVVFFGNCQLWFALAPAEACWAVYHSSELFEVVRVADYLKSNSSKSARIAVLGSEPEIYFYAHRRSATGYIYTYPLMELQPYALKMQEEMIGEIERARPEWVVYINDDLSWLPFRASERKIFDWWKGYWDKNLDMISMTPVREGSGEEEAKPAANKEGDPKYILLLKRKADQ